LVVPTGRSTPYLCYQLEVGICQRLVSNIVTLKSPWNMSTQLESMATWIGGGDFEPEYGDYY